MPEFLDRVGKIGVKTGQMIIKLGQAGDRTKIMAKVTADRESLEIPGHVLAQVGATALLPHQPGQQFGVPAYELGHLAGGRQGLGRTTSEGVSKVTEEP